jgi:hypothetical protein
VDDDISWKKMLDAVAHSPAALCHHALSPQSHDLQRPGSLYFPFSLATSPDRSSCIRRDVVTLFKDFCYIVNTLQSIRKNGESLFYTVFVLADPTRLLESSAWLFAKGFQNTQESLCKIVLSCCCCYAPAPVVGQIFFVTIVFKNKHMFAR